MCTKMGLAVGVLLCLVVCHAQLTSSHYITSTPTPAGQDGVDGGGGGNNGEEPVVMVKDDGGDNDEDAGDAIEGGDGAVDGGNNENDAQITVDHQPEKHENIVPDHFLEEFYGTLQKRGGGRNDNSADDLLGEFGKKTVNEMIQKLSKFLESSGKPCLWNASVSENAFVNDGDGGSNNNNNNNNNNDDDDDDDDDHEDDDDNNNDNNNYNKAGDNDNNDDEGIEAVMKGMTKDLDELMKRKRLCEKSANNNNYVDDDNENNNNNNNRYSDKNIEYYFYDEFFGINGDDEKENGDEDTGMGKLGKGSVDEMVQKLGHFLDSKYQTDCSARSSSNNNDNRKDNGEIHNYLNDEQVIANDGDQDADGGDGDGGRGRKAAIKSIEEDLDTLLKSSRSPCHRKMPDAGGVVGGGGSSDNNSNNSSSNSSSNNDNNKNTYSGSSGNATSASAERHYVAYFHPSHHHQLHHHNPLNSNNNNNNNNNNNDNDDDDGDDNNKAGKGQNSEKNKTSRKNQQTIKVPGSSQANSNDNNRKANKNDDDDDDNNNNRSNNNNCNNQYSCDKGNDGRGAHWKADGEVKGDSDDVDKDGKCHTQDHQRACIDMFSQESVISQLCGKMKSIENGNKCMTSQVTANQVRVDDQVTRLQEDIKALRTTVELLQNSAMFYAEAPFGASQVRGYKLRVSQGGGFEPTSGYFTAPYDGAYQITVGYFKRAMPIANEDRINVMRDSKAIFRLRVEGSEQQRIFLTPLQSGQSLWLKTNIKIANDVMLENHPDLDLISFGVVLVK